MSSPNVPPEIHKVLSEHLAEYDMDYALQGLPIRHLVGTLRIGIDYPFTPRLISHFLSQNRGLYHWYGTAKPIPSKLVCYFPHQWNRLTDRVIPAAKFVAKVMKTTTFDFRLMALYMRDKEKTNTKWSHPSSPYSAGVFPLPNIYSICETYRWHKETEHPFIRVPNHYLDY